MKKNLLFLVAVCCALCFRESLSQAVPAGDAPSIGFQMPTLGGTLNYALSASESVSKGFYAGSEVGASTSLSGNVALITASRRHPFSLVYSGGYFISNQNQPSSYFQTLTFSQVLTAGRWNFVVSDGISYLPQSPTVGLSGIPGVGDLTVDPVQVGNVSGIGILTYFGPRVSNSLSGSANRSITPSLSFQASGTYSTLRYLGSSSSFAVNGLDNTTAGGTAGLNYRIDARDNVGAYYSYSRFSFGTAPSFITQGANATYTRLLSKRLTMNLSAGPQRTSSSNSAFSNPSINFAGSAGLNYMSKTFGSSLYYSRGVSNGSGVIAGAVSDNVSANLHRTFDRVWNVSGSVGYSRSKSLPTLTTVAFSSNGVTASVQASRSLGRRFSAFASYTVQNQSVTSASSTFNAFNGVYQIVGLGITYSPSSINLGRR